jgi:hypothetical protein
MRNPNRSRLTDWEDAHENLLAELLSSDSGDAKDKPKENTDEEAPDHQEVV